MPALLLISFLLSSLFRFGVKDQDFYSYYYIGKGVAQGKDMYKDFADNKGPVWYLAFSGLYFVFGNNLTEALVISSTVFDLVAVVLLLELVTEWFGQSKWGVAGDLLTAILVLIFYKSLSMGVLIGGLYSENLANIFLFAAFLLFNRKRDWWSGIFFTSAIFTRLTFLFFGPMFFILRWSGKTKSLWLDKWMLGIFCGFGLVFLLLVYFGSLGDMINNMIKFNISFGSLYSFADKLAGLGKVVTLDIRLLLCSVMTILGWGLVLWRKRWGMKLMASALAGSSLIISFFCNGVFYTHQYLQFVLAGVGIIYFVIISGGLRAMFIPILVSLVLATVVTFPFYVLTAKALAYPNNIRSVPALPEVTTHKYLQVIPFYPSLYFSYNRSSPNRYYDQFFLSKYSSLDPNMDIIRYEALSTTTLKQTAFLVVRQKGVEDVMTKEYLQNFKRKFNLRLVRTATFNGGEMDVYLTGI